MNDQKNISNKAIAILVVMALLVTIISTWIVLVKIDSMQLADTNTHGNTADNGNLAITIIPESTGKDATISSGQIALSVNNN